MRLPPRCGQTFHRHLTSLSLPRKKTRSTPQILVPTGWFLTFFASSAGYQYSLRPSGGISSRMSLGVSDGLGGGTGSYTLVRFGASSICTIGRPPSQPVRVQEHRTPIFIERFR